MTSIAYSSLIVAAGLGIYTYLLYPLLLWMVGRLRRAADPPAEPEEWPLISITVSMYNEENQVREFLEGLLALDYPADRRQIVVVSDASTDRTDEIVREFSSRGVELLRMPMRRGKTAAENFVQPALRGEIVVNTDASIRIRRGALKPLIARFSDSTVGLASGRDVSVSRTAADANAGESGYVGYEMWLRGLETRVTGIVGASGCFYAIRAALHRKALPESLSRDFAAALITREHGYRAVSVDEAVCEVPRTISLQREYERKVRTITRGIETLWFKRHLLNPLRYPLFAWMLFSHKACRWLVPWTLLAATMGLGVLSFSQPWAQWMLGAVVAGCFLGYVGWVRSHRGSVPRWLALPSFALFGNLAAVHAGLRALHGDRNSTWEPTRRHPAAAR